MYISDVLRLIVSEKFSIDLEPFVWDDDLTNSILGIELGIFEFNIKTMRQVYELGLNIGYCGLTSRYVATLFKEAKISFGSCRIIEKTKRSPNGNHAFIILNDKIIDTSLRTILPQELAKEYGYSTERILAYESARMFSPYELYSHEFSERLANPDKFNNELLQA